MTQRALCFFALVTILAAPAAAQQTTIPLPDGRELTAAGGFSGDELARKVRELEANPQERPADPRDANPAQRTGTSRISGRIVNSNGSPLRRATVHAAAAALIRTTTTDPAGHYEFRDLPPGRYTVLAEKANYLGLGYGQLQPSDLYARVDVGVNQAVDGIDVTLPRGGVISGRVVDEFGEPATDLQVIPVRKSLLQGQSRPMPTGRAGITNDIGEYRVVGLPPGQYYLSVAQRVAAGFVGGFADGADLRDGYAPTYYPGTPAFASAATITVGMNETIRAVDIALVPARLATVAGIAVDAQGAPVRAGSVIASERNGNAGMENRAQIRPDGTFTLAPLPPGEYFLRASLSPPPPPLPSDTPLPVPSATLRAAIVALPPVEMLAATVVVNGSDVTGVALTPVKRVNVSGRIVFDSQGRRPPPQAVRLTFVARGPEFGMAFGTTAVVNDDFTFQFSLPAIELAVRPTVGDWVVKAIRVNGVDIIDAGVDLRGSQSVNVEVEVTNNSPEVSGVAVDARGQAITDYGVLVFPQDRDRRIPDSRLIAMVRSDAGGRYRVRTLPPGQYFAVPVNPQQVSSSPDLDLLDSVVGRATAFVLGANESKTVDLHVPGR